MSTPAPFLVVQLFDREGYYTSITAAEPEELRAKVAARSSVVKSTVACSLPFAGTWSGRLRDVSMPADFKKELAIVDRTEEP